ncbi:MAG: hypothetical protein GY795_33885 [Desulfobacterales bacterium]|nr:hypothetical protein [Desulfobacterales bacterium]
MDDYISKPIDPDQLFTVPGSPKKPLSLASALNCPIVLTRKPLNMPY